MITHTSSHIPSASPRHAPDVPWLSIPTPRGGSRQVGGSAVGQGDIWVPALVGYALPISVAQHQSPGSEEAKPLVGLSETPRDTLEGRWVGKRTLG